MSRSTRRRKRTEPQGSVLRLGRRVRADTELGEEIARLCVAGERLADPDSGRRGRSVRLSREDREYMATLQGAKHGAVETAAVAWQRPAGDPAVRLLDETDRKRLEAAATAA